MKSQLLSSNCLVCSRFVTISLCSLSVRACIAASTPTKCGSSSRFAGDGELGKKGYGEVIGGCADEALEAEDVRRAFARGIGTEESELSISSMVCQSCFARRRAMF